MDKKEILGIFNAVGAVVTNSHIVYTSGKHGSAYVNKDALYPHTHMTAGLCYEIAEWFKEDDIEAVIAPATGGIILSQWVAYHLTSLTGHTVLGLYAEKNEAGDDFVIKRGYDKLIVGKRVLVVEDILTTGGSVKKVVDAVRKIGGHIVGIGALVNRGNVGPEDVGGVPVTSLIDISLESWDAMDCPLCKKGVPINTDVGKGREFLAREVK